MPTNAEPTTPPEEFEADPGTKQAPRPLKRYLAFIGFQLLAVTGILICLEIVLAIFGVQKLDTTHAKPASTYPAEPADYVKLAVFGGSAAANTYSPRGFDDVLEYELQRRYPEKKFYVKNYASHGEPFHRHQAEYAKRLVDKYDFVLIYCGNNEAENWYDDSGYWRQPEFKEAKDLVYSPPQDAATWPWWSRTRAWLGHRSRIYSLAAQTKERFQPPVSKNRNRNYAEFESEPSVPVSELSAIVTNFESDIREICKLAKLHNTQILLATAATLETWPPAYSTFAQGVSETEKQQWQSHYTKGLDLLGDGSTNAAVVAFEAAAAIDSSVAILNYRMGIAHLELGDSKHARQFLSKAIDRDGHYFRPPSSLRDAAKKLATEIEHLHEVDIVAAFHEALTGELQGGDLFTDVCHPSFLGYTIIGHTFLHELGKLDPLLSDHAGMETTDWISLTTQLYRDLDVTPAEDKVAVAGNILYCFDLMHFSAYPESCIELIQDLMSRLEQLGEEDPMVVTFNAVCRARLAIRDANPKQATIEINTALSASPDDLDMILDLKAWNHYIEDEFSKAGISYSKDLGEFVLSDG